MIYYLDPAKVLYSAAFLDEIFKNKIIIHILEAKHLT
jgi:hypothetical protein